MYRILLHKPDDHDKKTNIGWGYLFLVWKAYVYPRSLEICSNKIYLKIFFVIFSHLNHIKMAFKATKGMIELICGPMFAGKTS